MNILKIKDENEKIKQLQLLIDNKMTEQAEKDRIVKENMARMLDNLKLIEQNENERYQKNQNELKLKEQEIQEQLRLYKNKEKINMQKAAELAREEQDKIKKLEILLSKMSNLIEKEKINKEMEKLKNNSLERERKLKEEHEQNIQREQKRLMYIEKQKQNMINERIIIEAKKQELLKKIKENKKDEKKRKEIEMKNIHKDIKLLKVLRAPPSKEKEKLLIKVMSVTMKNIQKLDNKKKEEIIRQQKAELKKEEIIKKKIRAYPSSSEDLYRPKNLHLEKVKYIAKKSSQELIEKNYVDDFVIIVLLYIAIYI
jgi:hypothetical protein